MPGPNLYRPFSGAELKKRDDLTKYLDCCSEDELIQNVLLPLFRQLGLHRIKARRQKDKALEYGKDIWMKYVLPTQHVWPIRTHKRACVRSTPGRWQLFNNLGSRVIEE